MKTLIAIAIFSLSLLSQERVLLRIGEDGQQEAIPIKKGESAKNAINRIEQHTALMNRSNNVNGLIDTLKYFNSQADFASYVGLAHQDVVLQWFLPTAGGTVKEFWWNNGLKRGVINQGTIRAWYIDPRVAKFPNSPRTKYIGYYKDDLDNDGRIQPFKPVTGNQWFYSNGLADSVTYSFDMFTKESKWLPGGLSITLDSNKWQGIELSDWGDSLNVRSGELFGFTLMNATKKSDIGLEGDIRMEISGAPNTESVPYHSFRFYETSATGSGAGWHMRGDYEWVMYVVIEYVTDRPPKQIVNKYSTTLSTVPRKIEATITDDNPGGGPAGIAAARLFTKVGVLTKYDSTVMTNAGSLYSGFTKAAFAGDTVYWYIASTDVNGNRSTTPVQSYAIFKKTKQRLFIYNNAGFSRANANLIYTGASNPAKYDFWSSPTDGTQELPELMKLYFHILIADGSFPARNVFTALKSRFATASFSCPVQVFFTSQDYGCFIEANCADTTFTAGSLEYDYFGLSKIGPQDIGPTNREFRIIPQPDFVTDYLVRFGNDSGSTLWHDPTFELGFSGYPDAMSFRTEAIPLFKDGQGNVLGGRFSTFSFRSMFVGFDIGSLQFRSDTSINAGADSKYKWVPTDVGSVANAFFNTGSEGPIPCETAVLDNSDDIDLQFNLVQNYPNPFNPATKIDFTLPQTSFVTITIYNVIGQSVATVVKDVYDPGSHSVTFNAQSLASGIYFYELRANNYTSVKKMLLLK